MISHQLCLEGPPDTMVIYADFKAFWLKEDKDQPNNRGLALRFPSWGKLRGVGGRILQFVLAARNGWSKKATKKPTRLSLSLNIKNINNNKDFLNGFPLPVNLAREFEMLMFRVCQYDTNKDDILTLSTGKKVSKGSTLWRLRPFWDAKDSVIRITGRAPSADLIPLPKDHPITNLFVS